MNKFFVTDPENEEDIEFDNLLKKIGHKESPEEAQKKEEERMEWDRLLTTAYARAGLEIPPEVHKWAMTVFDPASYTEHLKARLSDDLSGKLPYIDYTKQMVGILKDLKLLGPFTEYCRKLEDIDCTVMNRDEWRFFCEGDFRLPAGTAQPHLIIPGQQELAAGFERIRADAVRDGGMYPPQIIVASTLGEALAYAQAEADYLGVRAKITEHVGCCDSLILEDGYRASDMLVFKFDKLDAVRNEPFRGKVTDFFVNRGVYGPATRETIPVPNPKVLVTAYPELIPPDLLAACPDTYFDTVKNYTDEELLEVTRSVLKGFEDRNAGVTFTDGALVKLAEHTRFRARSEFGILIRKCINYARSEGISEINSDNIERVLGD